MLNPFCTTALRTRIRTRLRNATLCLGLLAASAAAWAVPVTWTLNNVATTTGKTITGSYVYDADTNTYSAINIVSGANTYTQFAGGNANSFVANKAPAGVGQAAVLLRSVGPQTNAGGVLNLSTGAFSGGLTVCNNALCSALNAGIDLQLAGGGTVTGVALAAPVAATPASVPTLGEWALMLLVVLMGWVGMGGLRSRKALPF